MEFNKILAFSHIPKSAGTTFNLMLRRYFGSRLLAARYRRAALKSRAYRQQDLDRDIILFPRLKCISGHSLKPFEDFGKLEQRMAWFTFLREPVDRFFSHYVHQQTSNECQFHLPLRAWAGKFDRRDWCVKMIAGERDLEAAKQILDEKFKFIGIVEKFQESTELFAKRFNLKRFATTAPPRQMVTRDPALKARLLRERESAQDVLEANTSLDQQLYDYAVTTLWPRQKRQIASQTIVSQTPLPNWRHSLNLHAFQAKDKLVYGPYTRWLVK